ncbi:hypothetical protein MMC07_003014 [Pseudocyphellaria aurata]|nr:hypothetical protein [Pseudocyphellaria aurata]
MDRLKTSLGPVVDSIHTKDSILNQDLQTANSSRSTAVDSSLMLQIDEVELYIRKLRCYWTAVADDLGPFVWASPKNMYRQIWEQEISTANSKLGHLKGQTSKTPCRTNTKPNKDRRLPKDILKAQLSAEEGTQARKKRTLKRRLGRQRAKARLSTTEASPCDIWSSSKLSHPLGTNESGLKLQSEDRLFTYEENEDYILGGSTDFDTAP